MGAAAIVDGLISTGIFTLSRRVQRGRIVAFELGRSLSTFVITLGIVYLFDPVGVSRVFGGEMENLPYNERLTWAVIGGWLGGRVVYAGLSYVAIVHPRPQFTWEASAVREIFGFGKWIFMSTGLTFLAMHTDRMIVPKLVGFEAGGLYGRALGLVGIPIGLMATFAGNVVFPLTSRLHEGGQSFRQASSKIYVTGSVIGAMLMSALIACGPSAARVLYPNTYADVGWILQLVAIAGWVGIQSQLAQNMLMAFNQRTAMVVPTIAKIVGIVVFLWPAVWFATNRGYSALSGLIMGFGAAELARYCATVFYANRLRMVTWQSDLLLGPAMLAIAGVGLAVGNYCDSELLGCALPATRLEWLRLMALQGTVVAVIWGLIGGCLVKLGYVRFK
jgi:O-antigen/teichoic acid export membrane protein